MVPVTNPPSAGLHLLLIDDDLLILKAVQLSLRADSHRLVVAQGGKEGLAAFFSALEAGTPFDVVITDLSMPEIDGLDVTAAIRSSGSRIPIVLMTGGDYQPGQGGRPERVDYVLNKPPRLADIRAALAAVTPASPSEATSADSAPY
jgi:CheY-like chemotaxis protein